MGALVDTKSYTSQGPRLEGISAWTGSSSVRCFLPLAELVTVTAHTDTSAWGWKPAFYTGQIPPTGPRALHIFILYWVFATCFLFLNHVSWGKKNQNLIDEMKQWPGAKCIIRTCIKLFLSGLRHGSEIKALTRVWWPQLRFPVYDHSKLLQDRERRGGRITKSFQEASLTYTAVRRKETCVSSRMEDKTPPLGLSSDLHVHDIAHLHTYTNIHTYTQHTHACTHISKKKKSLVDACFLPPWNWG